MSIRNIHPSEGIAAIWTNIGPNKTKINLVIKDWNRFMESLRKDIPAVFVAHGSNGEIIELYIEIDDDVKTL